MDWGQRRGLLVGGAAALAVLAVLFVVVGTDRVVESLLSADPALVVSRTTSVPVEAARRETSTARSFIASCTSPADADDAASAASPTRSLNPICASDERHG